MKAVTELLDLTGKEAIVTGGAMGIGLGITRRLARREPASPVDGRSAAARRPGRAGAGPRRAAEHTSSGRYGGNRGACPGLWCRVSRRSQPEACAVYW